MFGIKKKLPNETKKTNPFLLKISNLPIEDVYSALQTAKEGLDEDEAEARLKEFGKNEIAREKPPPWYWMMLSNFKNPFVVVLMVIALISYLTEDMQGTLVLLIMVVVSVLMRFIQEFRSTRAAEALRVMVRTKATVKRKTKFEIPIEDLVPGDMVYLSAGDMVPADVRLLRSKDLFISQSALTGESIPVEKFESLSLTPLSVAQNPLTVTQNPLSVTQNPLEKTNLLFMGSSVVSGFGKAVVLHTGEKTYFGSLSESIMDYRRETSFDKGVNRITWLLIRFILIMIPIIFLINGIDKHDWGQAFLFSLAVAVGLIPEMLPVIVTANLAKGAQAMAKLKVIVKRLNSIQSFGAMDVLCTDKTGTLTQDKIILERYLDADGQESKRVLQYGFLNSYFQSGLKNMLDKAILDHPKIKEELISSESFHKIDEIPFDFVRKRLSVVLRHEITPQHMMICKGALEQMIDICQSVETKGEVISIDKEYKRQFLKMATQLSEDGFRVIAVAYKMLQKRDTPYSTQDENDFVLMGLMAFLDPPKESAGEAIQILKSKGVTVKVLTGDNDTVTRRVCKEVDLPYHTVLLGDAIDTMTDSELAEKVESTSIFAKLTPLQKARIIRILQSNDHVVGFLGDGINDAPGLLDADVGISVDTATDIARESADIILLEKSLLVLGEGVLKGREVYGNIIKYIKMATSSNFGNVFSVLIASSFLPFLPMLPTQLLFQNLLYDFSQLSIPWDRMDAEFLKKPRVWDPKGIARFMVYMGPISSIFDVTTFLLLWFVFKANSVEHQAFFQTGWFVEGLLSQTLVVHMFRTRKIPFFQSTASLPVTILTGAIFAFGLYLPFSSLGAMIMLVPLPGAYFVWLFVTLFAYCVLAQVVKMWYISRFKSWL